MSVVGDKKRNKVDVRRSGFDSKPDKTKSKSKDGLVIGLILSSILFLGSVSVLTLSAIGLISQFVISIPYLINSLVISANALIGLATVFSVGSLFLLSYCAIKVIDVTLPTILPKASSKKVSFSIEDQIHRYDSQSEIDLSRRKVDTEQSMVAQQQIANGKQVSDDTASGTKTNSTAVEVTSALTEKGIVSVDCSIPIPRKEIKGQYLRNPRLYLETMLNQILKNRISLKFDTDINWDKSLTGTLSFIFPKEFYSNLYQAPREMLLEDLYRVSIKSIHRLFTREISLYAHPDKLNISAGKIADQLINMHENSEEDVKKYLSEHFTDDSASIIQKLFSSKQKDKHRKESLQNLLKSFFRVDFEGVFKEFSNCIGVLKDAIEDIELINKFGELQKEVDAAVKLSKNLSADAKAVINNINESCGRMAEEREQLFEQLNDVKAKSVAALNSMKSALEYQPDVPREETPQNVGRSGDDTHASAAVTPRRDITALLQRASATRNKASAAKKKEDNVASVTTILPATTTSNSTKAADLIARVRARNAARKGQRPSRRGADGAAGSGANVLSEMNKLNPAVVFSTTKTRQVTGKENNGGHDGTNVPDTTVQEKAKTFQVRPAQVLGAIRNRATTT